MAINKPTFHRKPPLSSSLSSYPNAQQILNRKLLGLSIKCGYNVNVFLYSIFYEVEYGMLAVLSQLKPEREIQLTF